MSSLCRVCRLCHWNIIASCRIPPPTIRHRSFRCWTGRWLGSVYLPIVHCRDLSNALQRQNGGLQQHERHPWTTHRVRHRRWLCPREGRWLACNGRHWRSTTNHPRCSLVFLPGVAQTVGRSRQNGARRSLSSQDLPHFYHTDAPGKDQIHRGVNPRTDGLNG